MVNFLRKKAAIIRVFALIALTLPVLVPVRSWVLAENEVRYFSSENVTYTSDFGIENPEGMAYFSSTDSFVVWGMNKSERMIMVRNESSKKTNFAQYITNPLGTSFDKDSNSLLSLGVRNTELHKIKVVGKNNQPLINESTSFNLGSLDL